MEIIKLLSIVVGITLVDSELPADFFFPKCKRHSKHLEQCLIAALDAVRPQLKLGIPEIEFPVLEPFELQTLPIESYQFGLKVKGVLNNIVAKGGGDFQIKNFKIDYNTNTAYWTVMFPKLDVTTDYHCEGTKLAFINVDTYGKFKGTFNDIKVDLMSRGRYDSDDDQLRLAYVTVTNLVLGTGSLIDIQPDDAGFFKKMGTAILNMSPMSFLMWTIKPSVERAAGPIIKKYVNKVLDELLLYEILSDNKELEKSSDP